MIRLYGSRSQALTSYRMNDHVFTPWSDMSFVYAYRNDIVYPQAFYSTLAYIHVHYTHLPRTAYVILCFGVPPDYGIVFTFTQISTTFADFWCLRTIPYRE